MATMPAALSHNAFSPCADAKRESETPSTSASSNHSTTVSPAPTPRANRELPSPRQIGFETPVHNTFIHYAQTADARSVQSMPHGMFGQCLFRDFLRQDCIK